MKETNIFLSRMTRNKTFFSRLIHLFSNLTTISINGTTKQKLRLDLNEYSYIMDRLTSEKTYWLCIKYHSHHCNSRIQTCIITNNVIKSPIYRTCTFDGTSLERRKFDDQTTSRSLRSQETPDIIYNPQADILAQIDSIAYNISS